MTLHSLTESDAFDVFISTKGRVWLIDVAEVRGEADVSLPLLEWSEIGSLAELDSSELPIVRIIDDESGIIFNDAMLSRLPYDLKAEGASADLEEIIAKLEANQ